MFETIVSHVSLSALTLLLHFVAENVPLNLVPFRYSYLDMTLLLVFWVVNYPRNSSAKDVYGIRESILQRVYRRILRIIQPFVTRHVRMPEHNTRRQIAQRRGFPQHHGDVNLIGDGTDLRCWIRRARGEQVKTWTSYKYRKPAFRVQCVITGDGAFVWFSDPIPASRHDVRAMRESNLSQFLAPNEKIFADTGYLGLNYCITPVRRPRNGELTREEARYNQEIQNVRRRIEQSFGTVKSKFAILRDPYRHEKALYKNLFGLCLALYNLTIFEPLATTRSRAEFLRQLPAALLRQRRLSTDEDEEDEEEYEDDEDEPVAEEDEEDEPVAEEDEDDEPVAEDDEEERPRPKRRPRAKAKPKAKAKAKPRARKSKPKAKAS
jgi:hypothetical protein